jgi:hypothetical protein
MVTSAKLLADTEAMLQVRLFICFVNVCYMVTSAKLLADTEAMLQVRGLCFESYATLERPKGSP